MKKSNSLKSAPKRREIESEYSIKEKSDYFIDITIKGNLTKSLFFKAIHELLCHPDYYERYDLWNLLDAQLRLTFEDMKEIAYVIRKIKPEKKVGTKKMAVLVSGEFNLFIIQFAFKLLSFLPFQLKIFDDYNKATNFFIE